MRCDWEWIIQNKEELMTAEKYGATRVELVRGMEDGGLTPTIGRIKKVLTEAIIPVFIMVRPRGSNFICDDAEFQTMFQTIDEIKALGGTHITTGALREDGTIHESYLQQIIEKHPQITITFHRAFDSVVDQIAAYKTLLSYKENVQYILTSGGVLNCEEGKDQLRTLVKISKRLSGPKIIAGAGLTACNFIDLHRSIQAHGYHFGCAMRKNSSFHQDFDLHKVLELKKQFSLLNFS